MDESKQVNVIDIKIIPNRFLKPDTSEKILNEIYELEGNMRVLIHGPSLPKKVFYGPGKGHEVNHTDRKTIQVKGNDVDLRVMVGDIIAYQQDDESPVPEKPWMTNKLEVFIPAYFELIKE